jgi:ABC-2 type transport system permease protein
MKLKEFKKYLKVYFLFTQAAFTQALITRFSSFIFLTGKFLRFLFNLFLVLLLVGRSQGVAGYSLPQVVLFFLIFNLVDVFVQLFLRGVYWFRGTIVSGSFDYYLVKPLNPLFRSLACHTDILDLITLIPLSLFTLYYIHQHSLILNFSNFLLFLFIFINGFFFALSLHILALAIGVLTTEVDHTIWIYRDLINMLRFPVEIYHQPIRIFLTFIIPVVIMINFPAKALMGLLSWPWVVYSFILTLFFLFFSLKGWHFSLKKYSSASS